MAKSEIFYPTFNSFEKFKKHYNNNLGLEIGRPEIEGFVYGGKDLRKLYSHIEIRANEQQLRQVKADVLLTPKKKGLGKIQIKDVSMRQFLIIGLPYEQRTTSAGCPVTDTWDGQSHWGDFHEQYRLELCHSEISRWSLFFMKEDPANKKVGIPSPSLSKKDYSIPDEISRVEIVNNCTTISGFEIRILYRGKTYHGSFKIDPDVYEKLSQFQAGALAMQQAPLASRASQPSFGWGKDTDIYHNFAGWDGLGTKTTSDGAGSGHPNRTIKIQLSRYLQGAKIIRGNLVEKQVDVFPGKIDYGRWGKSEEYYTKPKKRHLMMEIQDADGNVSYQPPEHYRQIHTAEEVVLPNFEPSGIYNIASPQRKRGYTRLAELKQGLVYKLDNGMYWLELRRQGCCNEFEFRRIVFGNIDLENIPRYDKQNLKKSFWTLHRFGYGTRATNQVYDKKFSLPHGDKTPPHFAYLLAGQHQDANHAEHYICPESFGIERAIFTWKSETELVIDLISFERILPVWQGKITFEEGSFESQVA